MNVPQCEIIGVFSSEFFGGRGGRGLTTSRTITIRGVALPKAVAYRETTIPIGSDTMIKMQIGAQFWHKSGLVFTFEV